MPSHPPSETQQFNRDVQLLLKPNNPHARSLLAFIKRTIQQFGLQAHITEIDIFVEAYLRGVRYTQQNQEHIRQPKAWMRRTAYNIIRECKRDRQRYLAVAFDELMEQESSAASDPATVDDEMIANAIASVLQALTALSPGDRNLIQWKVVEGLTWPQVQTKLVAAGEEWASLATLRKRGQRSLERLRHAYHIVNSDSDSELADDLADHPEILEPENVQGPESEEGLTPAGLEANSVEKVSWKVVFDGALSGTSDDAKLMEDIVSELRRLSKDTSLTLIKFENGSIVVYLDGSDEGYKIIASLINSGQLVEVLGLPIKEVGFIDETADVDQDVSACEERREPNFVSKRIEIPRKRVAMYQFLVGLPASQLDAVIFDLQPPRGNLPRPDAPHGDRVTMLIDWLESSVGPGLEALRTSIANVLQGL